MISKATFDRIQEARVSLSKPRHNRKADKGLQFMNFATCGSCGHSISGERHVKKSGLRFLYYRCTHKGRKMGCENRTFVRDRAFEAEVMRNMELVTIPDEVKDRYFAQVEVWESEELTEMTEASEPSGSRAAGTQ